METSNNDAFFREYTSQDAILKYTRATAGHGISYLLEHDYKKVYLEALGHLPKATREQGIRMLEFGCGGGMNLVHLASVLRTEGIKVARALGTDFSPVLIEAARRESKQYLPSSEQSLLEFHVAKNESLVEDLSRATGTPAAEVKGSLDFIIDVNTIRYCHAAGKQADCARDILDLLVPGGVCVTIDMNDRYPMFRSDLKNRLRRVKEEECVVPSLEAYAAPFEQAGFEMLRREHFCWIPHSGGRASCALFSALTPLLNLVARSRAMRSLLVARKPVK
jgi:SAM-dependent methyltransferase